MRAYKLVFSCLAALILGACNPTVRGLCHDDSACPEDTACEQGICVAKKSLLPDGGAPTDGGDGQCVPACQGDSTCVNGVCQPGDAPFVEIFSPTAGPYAAQQLTVSVKAHVRGGLTKLEVRLNNASGTLQTVVATPTAQPDEYSAVVDLTAPGVQDGENSLVAVMFWADQRKNSDAVILTVVKSGPTIRVLPINYPARSDGHPSTGAFLRNETVVIQAQISDDVVGLNSEPPTLSIDGMFPVTGVQSGPRTFTFSFNGWLVPFNAVLDNVNFKVTAKNSFGISSTVADKFLFSRWKWTWSKQRTGGIHAAPALSKGMIFLGSDDNYVYALRQTDGSQAWEFNASSPVLGHLTAGDSRIYAATKEGRVYALDPVDAPISDTQRRIFRCPDATGGIGQPKLMEFRTGVALAKLPVSSTNTTTEETLFAFTADGHLRMLRQSAFPQPFGAANSCVWDGPNGNWPQFNANDATVPTLEPSGSDLHVYLGDTGGVVRRLTIKLASGGNGQQPTYLLNQDWSKNVGGAIHASLPFGTFTNGTGVLAMREDSLAYGFDMSSSALWAVGARVLPAQTRMPATLTKDAALVVDTTGNLVNLRLDNGQPARPLVALNTQNTNQANAGPLTAADGRVLYASGTKLHSVFVGGNSEWIFEPTPSGDLTYLDIVTPALGCDGTAYVVASSSKRAYVHALITDSQSGLADGPWTRPNHDSRNTSNSGAALSTNASCTD